MVARHLAILIQCTQSFLHISAPGGIFAAGALTSHEIARYQILRCVQRQVLTFKACPPRPHLALKMRDR